MRIHFLSQIVLGKKNGVICKRMHTAKSTAKTAAASKTTKKSTGVLSKKSSTGTTAAKSVVPKKSSAAVAKKSTPGPKKAMAAPPTARMERDPSHRGMADPWFSLAAAGLKTKDIRQINTSPRPGMAGPAPLGYDTVKAGDIVTWSNYSIGVDRSFKAKIVSVTPCTSSDIAAILKKKGESVKFMPTLAFDQAVEVTNRLLHIKEGDAEKQFVVLEFGLA